MHVLRNFVSAGRLFLAACTAAAPRPVGLPSTPDLAADRVTEGDITLVATAEPVVVRAGQPIQVEAVLTHDQPEPLVVSGSGSGIVFFSVTRVEDGLTSGPPVMSMDCGRHELPAGEPLVVPFFKSGGHSPGDPERRVHGDVLRHP